MKNLYILVAILISQLIVNAQSFTVSGPRTIFELQADKSGAGRAKYTFFNLEKGKEIPVSDSATNNWDIAFSGTSIILNGGNSGTAGVSGQVIIDKDFNSLTSAPETGYKLDGAQKAIPTGSGNGWYNYNSINNAPPHSITPIPNRVIALKLANGKYAKLEIVNYYKDAPINIPTGGTEEFIGIGKYYSFRYLIAENGSTDLSQALTNVTYLNAKTNNKFFNLASADTVSIADSASTKWDLAFKSTTILTNSGTSGPGSTQSQIGLENFESFKLAPMVMWNSDSEAAKAIPTGSGNGWYVYNDVIHQITPIADRTILVKTTLNRFAKIKIENYYRDNISGHYSFSYFFQPDGSDDIATPITTSLDNNITENNSIGLYPNPISSQTDLHFSRKGIIQIYNALGEIVFKNEINDFIIKNLELNKGIYFVKIIDNNNQYQQKLIVE